MGYSHCWWTRSPALPKAAFARVVHDFKKLLPRLAGAGVLLAGRDGEGSPVLTPNEISFNGKNGCGHARREVGIAWPCDGAGGIATADEDAVDGLWAVGAMLAKRQCDGDCSHDSFELLRAGEHRSRDGRCFEFCKTAFKPYDLAVTACLVIAKHRLGSDIEVASDGGACEWADAKTLCQAVLGYGADVAVPDPPHPVEPPRATCSPE